jgi:hypothetical protein
MSTKTSALTSVVSLANNDLIPVVISPDTTPANRKITIHQLIGALPSNAHFLALLQVDGNATLSGPSNYIGGNTTIHGILATRNLTVANNNLIIAQAHGTPANSTSTTITAGSVFWDANYLYVATATNIVKRAALSTF